MAYAESSPLMSSAHVNTAVNEFAILKGDWESTEAFLNNDPSALAAKVTGAVLQMQRELQWFKEVEKLDHPLHKEVKNKDGKTARQVFKEEHNSLLEEVKNWLRDRSNSCMLVATLIATITFAAAITVLGGTSQDKGIPILLQNNTFIVFIFSDAIAFFSSMTSLLMLLPNSKGYFSKDEFVMVFTKILIFGYNYLFVAGVATMVAFVAALSMFLEERFKFSTIYIYSLACFPIIYSARLRYPNLSCRIKFL